MRLILLHLPESETPVYVNPLDITAIRQVPYVPVATTYVGLVNGGVAVSETPERVVDLVRRAVEGFEIIS